MIRNIFYTFLVCAMMFGVASQGFANTMPCSSSSMGDAAAMDMADCANTEMGQEQNGDSDSNGCCAGECTAMLQCSQASATFNGNASIHNPAPLMASRFLVPSVEAPHGLASLPEIRPPITA